MTITAQSAEQILKLLRLKVAAGTLDKDTAENLAILAIQEVQVADDAAEGAGTTDDGEEDLVDESAEEEEQPATTPAPAPVIDPSAQILALISQFDQGTASLWTSIKAKIEEVLKGVQGAAFPLGDFSSNASTAAKGNKTKVTISKGDNNSSVDVDFAFSRSWNIPGLNPPEVQASAKSEPTCHLGLRKEFLALAEDLTDMTDSELVWARSRFPEKTISYISAEAEKANDLRVVEAVKALPSGQDRQAWRKWSLAAQVYVIGSDYAEKKTFDELVKEIKE